MGLEMGLCIVCRWQPADSSGMIKFCVAGAKPGCHQRYVGTPNDNLWEHHAEAQVCTTVESRMSAGAAGLAQDAAHQTTKLTPPICLTM